MKQPRKQKAEAKAYWEMTTEELAEATKEYDREIPPEKLRPLTKEQRRRWERMKRQPSRSIFIVDRTTRKGAQTVLLELDGDLLRRIDAYAASRGMTRSQLIETGLRSVLSFAEAPQKRNTRRSA